MKIEKIGSIDHGIDGSDTYVHFKIEYSDKEANPDDIEWEDLVHERMAAMYWRECYGTGQYYCTNILVMPMQYSSDCFIAIAQGRYDN